MKSKLQKKEKQKTNYLGRWLIVLIVLILVIFILFQFSKVKYIEIDGNIRYSDEEILSMLNINLQENVLDIFYNRFDSKEELPYIREVDIQYTGPNKIKIIVKEKDIIGYIPYMDKYLCIDYEGYIMDYTNDLEENIPIVEGIEISNFTINEKLEVSHKIIEVFVMFYEINENYDLNIDFIKLENNDLEDDSIENIMIKLNNIKVIFGSTERSEYKAKVLVEVLEKLEANAMGIIDLSGDLKQVIFKKNDDSEN